MTHIECLTYRPHNPHGLRLGGKTEIKRARVCVCVSVSVCVCVCVGVLRAGAGERSSKSTREDAKNERTQQGRKRGARGLEQEESRQVTRKRMKNRHKECREKMGNVGAEGEVKNEHRKDGRSKQQKR